MDGYTGRVSSHERRDVPFWVPRLLCQNYERADSKLDGIIWQIEIQKAPEQCMDNVSADNLAED